MISPSLAIFLSQTAQDISEVNVLALFECLSTRGSALLNENEPNPSSSCCQSTDSFITEEKIQNDPPASQTHTEPEQHPAEQQTHELGNAVLCHIVYAPQNKLYCIVLKATKQFVLIIYSSQYICFLFLCSCRCAQFEWSESVISLSKLPLKNKYRNLFNTIFCSAR